MPYRVVVWFWTRRPAHVTLQLMTLLFTVSFAMHEKQEHGAVEKVLLVDMIPESRQAMNGMQFRTCSPADTPAC